MRRLAIFISAFLSIPICHAGLITHTDYSSAGTITAAGQNANENTIVNEFNGNIDNNNIKTGGVTGTNIAATTIDSTKLASTVTSTFTAVNNMMAYRRPNLVYIDTNTVDIENNTGTSNQTCVLFPDGQRCVTENTSTTNVNRRFLLSATASNSGTKDSGLIGAASAVNTAYALYAWEVSDVSTDFVIVGTTNAPTQANYAGLNTLLGTSKWVYLGTIFNGDRSGGSTTGVVPFVQNGSFFLTQISSNSISSNWPQAATNAILLNNNTGSSTVLYTYVAGNAAGQIPANITTLYVLCESNNNATGILKLGVNNTNSVVNVSIPHANTSGVFDIGAWLPASGGVNCRDTASNSAMSTGFSGWTDKALGAGVNPQL